MPDGCFRKLPQRAAPESCLKTIYKSRYAGVESFAPLAGPATAGEKSCENRMQDCVQNEAKGCPKCFVVAPSVPDGGSEPLAEGERYTGTGVQNELK